MAHEHDVDPGSSPEDIVEVIPPATPAEEIPPEPAPGSKTPPENLKAALDEERRLRQDEKRRREEAEERARLAEEALSSGVVPPAEYSDEGKEIIEKHVKPLAAEVTRLTEELTMKDILEKFPALKDKQAEFAEFRKARPSYTLEDAAKLYLNDNNLLTPPARRKGLEEPRGGDRTPPQTKMSAIDIDNLRKTDYAKYVRLLREGKIDLDNAE